MWLSKLIPFRVVFLGLLLIRQWAELLKVFEPGKGCGLDVTTEEAAIHEASVSYYETCWMEIGPSVESAARTRDQQHTRLNYFISFAEPY
ncbi:hypothetical protein PC111_g17326 [Phytophthora cactorum]|nr:hypothetical protein PC111_g17326 [Phytophthora cactorum]